MAEPMTDHFARLDEPRRPWIEGDRLEEAFLTRSRETHPDHVAQDAPAARTAAQEKFTALNAAHQ